MPRTIALFGVEGPGRYWMHAVARHPELSLAALVDSDRDLLSGLRAQGIPSSMLYESFNEAMERVRPWAVICSLPSPWKQSVLRWALKEGVHVITDKPLAHTEEQVHWLIESARGSRSVFQVAQTYRLLTGPLVLKTMIDGGEFGRPANISARFLRDARELAQKIYNWQLGWVPLGLEICIHHFDLMRYLLGADPVTVFGRGWRHPWDWGSGFTALDALLEFPDGVRVSYHADWSYLGPPTDWGGCWDISLERGAAFWAAREGLPQLWDRAGISIDPTVLAGCSTTECRTRDDTLTLMLDRLVAAVDRQGSAFCPLEDNVRSIGILHALNESHDRHTEVEFSSFLQRTYGLLPPLPAASSDRESGREVVIR